jgi:hypothetical protein
VSHACWQKGDRIEDLEDLVEHPYGDTEGIATIGFGFNLREHGLLVLETLGFDVSGTTLTGNAYNAEQDYIERLLEAFDGLYPNDTAANNPAHAAISAIVQERLQDADYAAFPAFDRVSDLVLAEPLAASILNVLMDTGYTIIQPPAEGPGKTFVGYETQLDAWLTEEVGGVSAANVTPSLLSRNSNERLALLSLLYNAPTLLGDVAACSD